MSYEIKEKDIGLCDYWTRRWFKKWGMKVDEDDIQDGRLGMMEAVDKYDESRGKFWNFAPVRIQNRLIRSNFGYEGGKRSSSCVFKNKEAPLYLDEQWYRRNHHFDQSTLIENIDLINKTLKTMYPSVAKAVLDRFFWGIPYEETGTKFGFKKNCMPTLVGYWRKNTDGYNKLLTKDRQKKFWNGQEVDFVSLANAEIEKI